MEQEPYKHCLRGCREGVESTREHQNAEQGALLDSKVKHLEAYDQKALFKATAEDMAFDMKYLKLANVSLIYSFELTDSNTIHPRPYRMPPSTIPSRVRMVTRIWKQG